MEPESAHNEIIAASTRETLIISIISLRELEHIAARRFVSV
jgi:hypothetical protein